MPVEVAGGSDTRRTSCSDQKEILLLGALQATVD
jgi:hypothetical protein